MCPVHIGPSYIHKKYIKSSVRKLEGRPLEIILRQISKKRSMGVWTEIILSRTGNSGRLYWAWWWIFGFMQVWNILTTWDPSNHYVLELMLSLKYGLAHKPLTVSFCYLMSDWPGARLKEVLVQSVYRCFSLFSWTNEWTQSFVSSLEQHLQKCIECLKTFIETKQELLHMFSIVVSQLFGRRVKSREKIWVWPQNK